MIADNGTSDLLDLDEFTRQFEAGELSHLTDKKLKKVAKTKPVLRLVDKKPSEIVTFIDRITCTTCRLSTDYVKGWGLKTSAKTSSSVTAVSEVNRKMFEELKKAEAFAEPYVTEVSYLHCSNCNPNPEVSSVSE